MKRFLLLHVGFEKPTPEIMGAWRKWFADAAANTVENVGLRSGREITRGGVQELTMGPDALTGYTIVNVETLAEAEALARACPYISAIRVYELAAH